MKKIFNQIILLIIVSIVSMDWLHSQSVTEGANIGFMSSTPPNWEGWVRKVGKYVHQIYGAYETAPTWDWTQGTPHGTFNPDDNPSDSYGTFFEINTDTNAYDAKTNGGLKKIPSGYLRSARINNQGGNTNCSQLTMLFSVTANNCLLTFNYAMVLMAPHPGEKYNNPTFQIDIMDENETQLINSCAFFEKSGDVNTSNLPAGWHLGVSEGYYDKWIYCDWQQVSLNLTEYVGTTVKLRIRVSDCAYTMHGGYGYFTAKCDPPSITLSGCTGDGDTVTTVDAPKGFEKYEWFEVPTTTLDIQSEFDNLYYQALANNNIISDQTEYTFAILNNMMNGAITKKFVVRLTSKTMHVDWNTSPPSPCVAYIPVTVNDMRPNFDLMHVHGYQGVDLNSDEDEVAFYFEDVKPSDANLFPLDWQKFDFGDGDTLELVYDDVLNMWEPDDLLSMAANHSGVGYNGTLTKLEKVFHTYQQSGSYIVKRYAHTKTKDEENSTATETVYIECEKEDTLHVNIYVRPTLQVTAPDTVCVGSSVTFEASSPGSNTTGYTYKWYKDANDVNNTPLYEGTVLQFASLENDTSFYVVVTTPEGFQRAAEVKTVVQQFPDINIIGETMICYGQNLVLDAIDNNGHVRGIQWMATKPSLQTNLFADATTTASYNQYIEKDTVIYIFAETTRGCKAWKELNIEVVTPKLVVDKQAVCLGETITLTCSDAYEYSWNSYPQDNNIPLGKTDITTLTLTPDTTTAYTMTGYGSNGCKTDVGVMVKVVPYPEIKIAFSPNYIDVEQPILFIVDSSTYAKTSQWTFSDGATDEGLSVRHEFLDISADVAKIHLLSTNELGCSSQGDTLVPIVLFAVWTPNAFTPNGDNENDYFFFITENTLEDVQFDIFDRWGTKVFSKFIKKYEYKDENDIKLYGWDGTYKNKYVQNGVYMWKMTYKRQDSIRTLHQNGTVTVIR